MQSAVERRPTLLLILVLGALFIVMSSSSRTRRTPEDRTLLGRAALTIFSPIPKGVDDTFTWVRDIYSGYVDLRRAADENSMLKRRLAQLAAGLGGRIEYDAVRRTTRREREPDLFDRCRLEPCAALHGASQDFDDRVGLDRDRVKRPRGERRPQGVNPVAQRVEIMKDGCPATLQQPASERGPDDLADALV